MTTDDRELLRRYTREGSDEAFAELVERHLGLVYSAALRRVQGDHHLAQDIAQLVFANLARKARSLSSDVVLAGWLHRDTCFTTLEILRRESRRRVREERAATMHDLDPEPNLASWDQISPFLDDALNQLPSADRDALLLRFFENRSLAAIGERLGSGESGASRRVSRALEKLRVLLHQRGIATSAAALTVVLGAHGVQAAPAGLASSLSIASLTSAASTTSKLGILKIMACMKCKVCVAAALATALITPVAVHHYRARHAQLKEDESIQFRAKLNATSREMINLMLFCNDHENRFPNPSEAAGFLSSSFELVVPKGTYEKLSDIREPAGTIVVREVSAWRTGQGKWARAYGFADGHAEVGLSSDGDFRQFEQGARQRRAF